MKTAIIHKNRLFVFCLWLALISLFPAGVAYAQDPGTMEKWWIYITMAMLLIIFGGVIAFMFILQKNYLTACAKSNQIQLYAQSAAGLPEGTIRAMISFIIIAVSLYLGVLLFFKVAGDESRFPEALSSLLGAVVGFYFGTKSGGKGENEGLQNEVKDLKTTMDTSQSATMLGKIKKGLEMSRTVISVLPPDQKKRYGDYIAKLELGYKTVETLCNAGSAKDAAEKGQELFDYFRMENPARAAFVTAISAFGAILGGTGPALAVIATVTGCGMKLVGSLYEKWKRRILNVPITLAMLPLKSIDANTGFTFILQSEIFKSIFAGELADNDRKFMTRAAELIKLEDVEPFWNDYKARFDSRSQFDRGLQEFRRAALDSEIIEETGDNPSVFAPAGGVQGFMRSVDRINSNEDAQAALHQLTVVVEELQKNGEPVRSIFDKIQKEEGL